MRGETTRSDERDEFKRLKNSLQMGFCRARIQQATRTQRTLRLGLKQVDKRYRLLVGHAQN